MGWLNRMLGSNPKSGSVAKQRLQMVLTHDRGGIPPGLLDEIRDEIIEMLTRKLKVNPRDVQVNLSETSSESRLVAEIPLQTLNRRRQKNSSGS